MSQDTLFDKVWDLHKVSSLPGGSDQIFIGLHLIHEVTSPQAFGALKDKLGADWAIAISGIAGPNGGSQDKPVGLVFISISGPNNHITNIKKLFNSTRNRKEIQTLSVNVCLNSLRLILLSNGK